jgi:predicted amidophosphoribosyltransferase
MTACGSCKTELRADARFCDVCGQPVASPSPGRIEYTEVSIPLKHLRIFGDGSKNPPHPESYFESSARARRAVDQHLASAFAQGWSLDGPFDAAVNFASEDHTSWLMGGNRSLYLSARARLRRVT